MQMTTSWISIVSIIKILKGVFGSFLCASFCAGVPSPQNPVIAGSNPTGGLSFYFCISLFLKIN